MVRNSTTIQVDLAAAEILRRADAHARSQGETLGDYLRHALPQEVTGESDKHQNSQAEAWAAFVLGMSALVQNSVPAGHVADDSRESMYDDRA